MKRALSVVFLLASALYAAKPNILVIYADDLGFGDLGAYNAESKIPTPHLDKLASQGTRFTDGHSSSGICAPSRYALLTGRHHWRDFHGIVNALGNSVFKPERLTMPEMFKAQGYRTAAIGKWHLGWDWDAIRKPKAKQTPAKGKGKKARPSNTPDDFDWSKPIPNGPLAHGFDSYFGDTVINFPPYCWIENDRVPRAPDTMMDSAKWPTIKEGRWECRPGPMISDWNPYENIPTTTRKAVEFLDGQKDSDTPFFLYFAFPSPHAPIIPNDRFDGRSKAGPYGDFVCETDDSVGQLLAALERSGKADNTIVVFTADNGPEKYAYARDEAFDHWSAKPFRGLKRDIYEGGHHVPFIVRWPGLTKPGSVSDALISQIDLMGTFAAALGVELPDDAAEDSHNMLPYFKGEAENLRTAHVHNTFKDAYAMRHGDWVLLTAKTGYHSGRNATWEKKHKYTADKSASPELYNLKTDIGQRVDLADKHPEIVQQLTAMLSDIRKRGHSAPRLSK
ncbi:MAG: arylsulfatase A [Rhodothermales bacterium]|jgi:arylsulfatase A